ncbi:MAG: cupin domain-containing protein [Betaproteobacteria bacterium]|nr:cupin domain-containing protein [Betaproteobacteria bacterium]
MTAESRLPPVRRVVTGHTTDRKATVLIDGPAPVTRNPAPGLSSATLWCTERTPAPIPVGTDIEDMGARTGSVPPLKNGTRFAVLDFLPGNTSWMHRTESVDYVVVMSGEIDVSIDDATLTLRAGDVMVQRGTNHAYLNRGTGIARVAFMMVDAEPLGFGNTSHAPRSAK